MSSSRSSTRKSFICRSSSPRSCLRMSSGSLVRKRTRLPGVRWMTEGGFIGLQVYATREPPLRHPNLVLSPCRAHGKRPECGVAKDAFVAGFNAPLGDKIVLVRNGGQESYRLTVRDESSTNHYWILQGTHSRDRARLQGR